MLAAGALLGAAVLTGCGVEDHGVDVDRVDIAVQPRVVLDGTIELSDRTAGRVIIDEVIAHAPVAILHEGSAAGEVVVDASDPLLFRYALADRTGFGAALASKDGNAERIWSIPVGGAAVDVSFGTADDDIADDYDAHSDVLTGLGGHTLIIHGTIAVETEVQPFGGLSDVDPDGSAADEGDTHADVDPDGTPATDPDADVDPDGGAADEAEADGDDVSDVDPDGGAATNPGGGDVSDVDPDGGAAKPTNKPDASDVDPDGTPASGTNTGEGRDGNAARPQKSSKARVQGQGRRAVVNVPFSLVADGSFRRQVVLGEEDIDGVAEGDVMPLDLHLSAGDLLDADRIADLEAVAVDALAEDDDAVVVLPVSKSSFTTTSVKASGSIKKPRVVAGGSKIRVSGDLRR